MMQIPLATYRIQFHSGFTFKDAEAIAAYLADLGVSDLYASPVFTARKGSSHGYDVVNPQEINPELGGIEGFEELVKALNQRAIGWVQDIVPNHMAFDSQNEMLMDVLENGPDSQFRDFFDIAWDHPYDNMHGRVLAPFLGKFYGDSLESGELQLRYEERGFSVNYYDLKFPLRIESYTGVLTHNLAQLREKLGRDDPDFVKLLGILYALKYIPSGEDGRERYNQIAFIKRMLWELWNDSPEISQFIEDNIQFINGEPGNPESYNLLDSVLTDQFFRLSYWKVGNEELNYRRFFTVNDLISLRVEDQKVFDTIHQLPLQLIQDNKINGLRVDHIDGLYNPAEYLSRLRDHVPDAYLVVEKILEENEELPLNWSIQGTTGYDYMTKVNNLFCQQENQSEFDAVYFAFVGRATAYEALVDENKRMMIGKHLAGDIDNLAHLLKQLSSRHRYASDFTMYGLKRALVEVLTLFPVYRTYISPEGSRKADQDCMKRVLAEAQEKTPNSLNELYFIEKFLLLEFDDSLTEEDKQLWLHFLMRLQQYTGPLMAKGVEDTVMYIYNRLISLNEVGSHPGHFGISVDDFHTFNQDRCAQWPHAMNATATHDTKRGEDARARLNVLSEIPHEWEEQIRKWHQMNAAQKTCVEGIDAPDRNDEYFLYQTLLGSYPFTDDEYPQFIDRVKEYLIKAIREAKVHSNWLRPDDDYENALIKFAEDLLKDPKGGFMQEFRPFQRKIQHYGICNSLSQTLLKLASPGVPDLYQGSELWDLSMVDPDNRRPVDFAQRSDFLKKIKTRSKKNLSGLITELLQAPEDGRLKLFLIHRLIQARRTYSDLFQRGSYQKLTVLGSLKAHVVAFTRELGDMQMIAIAPRLLTPLVREGEYPIGEQVWRETRILQPPDADSVWHNAVTGQKIEGDDTLWMKEILSQFPVALLFSHKSSESAKS
jgi:(1->4)-alpha-D-glucan 1-alpha-D-glucosylmutase